MVKRLAEVEKDSTLENLMIALFAKRELANALPYIEMTQDVARYKAKIDAAR